MTTRCRHHPIARLALAPLALAAVTLAHGASLDDDGKATVIVTATRHAMLEVDAPAATSVVTRREIEQRGADNVLEAIRGEAGVSLQGRSIGGRKVISLRGMDSKHTLFLVDGRRVGASDGIVGHSDFQYDWIAVEDIERIEIVRGPMSVLYGSDAMGGVVNVVTRRAGDRWRGSASLEGSWAAGSRGGDGHRAAARIDGPLGAGLALRAGASLVRRDAVASPADLGISELEGRDKRDAWLGLGWTAAPGQRIDLEHRAGTEDRDADARERSGARRYHRSFNDIERAMTSLAWDADWGGSAALSTQLRAYRAQLDVANRRTAGVAVNPPQRITEEVVEGQARWAAGTHALTVGFEARNEALRDPGLPGGRQVAPQRSLFVQDELPLTPALGLTLGLRHDDHALHGAEASPRAYLVWRVAPQWTLKGGYSHGFKAPNLKQIVPGARPEGPNTFLGNPALRPETSDSVELGLGWAAAGTEAQVMLYEQRVDDLIEVRLVTPGPVPGLGTYTYENLARARMRGLEASLAHTLGGGFSTVLSWNWLDATDGSGRRLERRPRQTAAARLDWQGGPWRAGVRLEHSGDVLLASAPVAQTAPAVTLAGAHLVRALPMGLELSLGIDNLTDVNLAEKSPLFTAAEAPRTWRLALRGRW